MDWSHLWTATLTDDPRHTRHARLFPTTLALVADKYDTVSKSGNTVGINLSACNLESGCHRYKVQTHYLPQSTSKQLVQIYHLIVKNISNPHLSSKCKWKKNQLTLSYSNTKIFCLPVPKNFWYTWQMGIVGLRSVRKKRRIMRVVHAYSFSDCLLGLVCRRVPLTMYKKDKRNVAIEVFAESNIAGSISGVAYNWE